MDPATRARSSYSPEESTWKVVYAQAHPFLALRGNSKEVIELYWLSVSLMLILFSNNFVFYFFYVWEFSFIVCLFDELCTSYNAL